ncbi:MAG: lipoyl(octanoyl) transferase LipB [candidate division WOR-3 bacterium]
MKIIDLGVCEYKLAEDFQKEIHQQRVRDEIPDTLIFVIHPPVITLGKNGKMENLLVSVEKLQAMGISFYRTERGGDITYHGFGQLLIYPIFFLKEGMAGIRRFINYWEGVIIQTLKIFGIAATADEKNIGIYVQGKKIASFGFALKDKVTYHGIALNVLNDLKPFSFIHPCGKKNLPMTAMENILGKRVEMNEVKEVITRVVLSRRENGRETS